MTFISAGNEMQDKVVLDERIERALKRRGVFSMEGTAELELLDFETMHYIGPSHIDNLLRYLRACGIEPGWAVEFISRRKLCSDCGHCHRRRSVECPDHQWKDGCPYVGVECMKQVME